MNLLNAKKIADTRPACVAARTSWNEHVVSQVSLPFRAAHFGALAALPARSIAVTVPCFVTRRVSADPSVPLRFLHVAGA